MPTLLSRAIDRPGEQDRPVDDLVDDNEQTHG
jgi:hypothetical protein